MANRAVRQANIELLRITSMLSVILIHFFGVGGVMTQSTGVWFAISSTIYAFAMVAPSCYVLISGYFLATSKFRSSRVFRTLLEFFIYTFGIYLLFCLLVYVKNGDVLFSWHEFLTYYLFPVVHEENWFVTCYLLMLLFSPFYNVLLRSLSQRQHKVLILLCLFLFCGIPTVIWNSSWQFVQNNGYSFIWFTVLYFVAAYFRKYGVSKTYLKPWVLFLTYFLCSCISALLVNHEALHPGYLSTDRNGYYYFFNYNFATMFIASAAFFLLFHYVNIRSENTSKVINRLASYSFAVFLIHTHPAITGALWTGIVQTDKWVNSPLMLVVGPLSAVAIYLVCSAIEQLRMWACKPIEQNKTLNAWFAEIDIRSGFNENQ